MNKCFFIGRLTKDPEVNNYSGFSVCIINLAIDRGYKNREGEKITDFLQFVFKSESLMKFIKEYVKKGQLVSIVSRLENSNYEKNGEKVYKNKLVGKELLVLDWNKKNKGGFDDLEIDNEIPRETPF